MITAKRGLDATRPAQHAEQVWTVVNDLRPVVTEVAREIADLRPLTFTTRRVLAITESDHFSARELGRVISSDQALTAKMLRLSNSAYYGYPRRILTVHDAIVMLGFRAVRSATLGSSLIAGAGDPANLDTHEFWRNSVSVGLIAEVIAQVEGVPDEEAFTAGVLHNIGRLALDQHMPRQFAEVMRLASRQHRSLSALQEGFFGFSDAGLGCALALSWNLPEELALAVRDHALLPSEIDDRKSLTGLVVRARLLARSFGIHDGVEPAFSSELPREWTEPPLAKALFANLGGRAGLLSRVGAFLESTRAA